VVVRLLPPVVVFSLYIDLSVVDVEKTIIKIKIPR